MLQQAYKFLVATQEVYNTSQFTHPTIPPPAPSSTIRFPCKSFVPLNRFKQYFERHSPAGHICPPHPRLRSSCSFNGQSNSPSKSTSEMRFSSIGAGGTRSAPRGSISESESSKMFMFGCKYVQIIAGGVVGQEFRGLH